MNILDTIAAVATPYGKGGVAMIRISGGDALAVAERIFRPRSGKPLSAAGHAHAVYGDIYDSNEPLAVDDGMATVFFAPHSFTGEDTVEITCHGGILVTKKVLSAALTAGARMAEAGEFTRRAYVSGKMGLSQAEALGNLLEAANEGQLLLARGGMRGRLSGESDALSAELRRVLATVYAQIDFPDEDLGEMTREEIVAALEAVQTRLEKLASTYRTGRAVAEGIPTVICGRANAGKSSVYNRILGYDAAIVTDVAGTTRDVLRETAVLGTTTLRLADTAGLRETDDRVESIGIARTWEELGRAELILAVFDVADALCEENLVLARRVLDSGVPAIALLNKTDLASDASLPALPSGFAAVLPISARTGNGFDRLAEAVDALFIDGSISLGEDAIVTGARQYAAVKNALSRLDEALTDLSDGISLDLCCIAVETALSALGEVDGREIGEEIVAEIFSKFCVGK